MVVGFIFSKPLTQRYDEALRDLNKYQNNNSVSSLGARLAMYQVGMEIFSADPLAWRTAEARSDSAKAMVKSEKSLAGALPYLNVHLHNEVIEAGSLKGVAGILATVLFYAALFFASYHFRLLGLFTFSLAIIGLGFSDVLIWARSIPIIMICGIAVLLLFRSRRSAAGQAAA